MIVYDLQALQSAAHGERGIARYVADLAMTLADRHPGAVDVFAWNDRMPRVARLDDLGLGDRLTAFSELRNREVDVLHVNSPFELNEYGEIGVPVRARRLVATCYDLIPYRFPDRYFRDSVIKTRYRTRLNMLLAADAVVTDSRSAADDVEQLLGVSRSRLTVIGAGVGSQFRLPTTTLAERISDLRLLMPDLLPRFVLVPAGMDWRKNIDGAIAAFGALPAEVRARHQLVLACKVGADERAWVEGLARDAGIADRLIVTGYVTDEVLVALYQSAELVLFPSFYEGFGLPVLEARRCGARVICSGSSSLPEVIVDERATFNPWLIDDITATLLAALTDPELIAVLDGIPDPGFTWERAADRLVEVYEQVSTNDPPQPLRRRTTERKRLAVVTLLPPIASGIADHSRRMVEAIHDEVDDVDVTVFVDQVASWSAELRYPVLELATLPPRWQAGEFDEVLYCFGNNAFHQRFYPTLKVVPGHALLHDIRLLGAFNQRRLDLLARDVYDGNDDGSALFAQPIAQFASSVMVQSQHAAELVAADGGGVAIDVGPIPCQAVPSTQPIVDGGLPWVVSAGIAHASKQTDRVAEAMDLLIERGLVRAAIIGPGAAAFVGDDTGIVVPGHVDEPEYDRWLRSAAVLVQLRGSSNGESSGVVADAFARGVPTVVTALGAMSELPADACRHVSVDITAEELAEVIADLVLDPARRAEMRSAALDIAAQETPLRQARRILDVIFG